jgi:Tfp pilus assembly major pilin PilA
MATRRRQRGLSIISFLFVAGVIAIVAMLGFRVAPAVIEYYSIKQALSDSLQEIRDPGSSIPDVRNAFRKKADAGYITSVRPSDIEITRDKNEVIATVSWSRNLHLIANASLLLEFEATAKR